MGLCGKLQSTIPAPSAFGLCVLALWKFWSTKFPQFVVLSPPQKLLPIALVKRESGTTSNTEAGCVAALTYSDDAG